MAISRTAQPGVREPAGDPGQRVADVTVAVGPLLPAEDGDRRLPERVRCGGGPVRGPRLLAG